MSRCFNQPQNIFLATRDFEWGSDLDTIVALVASRFSDFNDNGFHPHPDEVQLQLELQTLPSLRRVSAMIRDIDARGLIITKLGLSDLDEARRNAVLYAIALCQGFPTSTDQRTRRVAWDVRARTNSEQQTRFVSFSERVGKADMHTDSSFYPMPEEQFILYVVQAARCGGESLLIDVDDIHAELLRSAAGRATFALLSKTPVPFRVPAVFAANEEQIEIYLAPVFHRPIALNGALAMRWRYDSIKKGLAASPQLDTPALHTALELLNEVIEQRAQRFCLQLPNDTLLWADNQRTLHGRMVYTDPARHLIRIRMSDTPNAERIGPSGISAD